MPRKDRTFTDKDVIRIVNKNLSPEERLRVLLTLCEGVKIEDFGLGPVLVPESVELTTLQETNLIELLVSIVSGAILRELPEVLADIIGFVIDLDLFERAVVDSAAKVAKRRS